jgi:hypothetical protein
MSILKNTRVGARAIVVDKQYFLDRGFYDDDNRIAFNKESKNSKYLRMANKWGDEGATQYWVWNSYAIDNPIKVELLIKIWTAKQDKTRRGFENKLREECNLSRKTHIGSHEIRPKKEPGFVSPTEKKFDKSTNTYKKSKSKKWR